jgi:hypothetical protein
MLLGLRLKEGNNLHAALPNKRLEQTRHERASYLSCVGEPLKRNVSLLLLLARVGCIRGN